MMKRISTVALATLLCLPALASASMDKVAELEKQMAEMSKMFQAQLEAMKGEIASLKAKDQKIEKEVSQTASAAEWTKKVKLDGQVRMRGYNIQNVWDLNDDGDGDNRDLFRLKTSVGLSANLTDDVTGHIRLTNQTWGEGVSDAADNNSNKLFVENAWMNVKNVFGSPFDAKIGRQNLIYGSGFVILDGQSQMASTSIYFDGIKLSWDMTDKVVLDAFYMKDQENTVANSANGNAGDDINLAGFYLTANSCPIIGKQEYYALNRNDDARKKDIWTYGVRLSDKLANGFDYSLEGAMQTGDANATQDQDSYGMKLNAGYTFKDAGWKPRLYAEYVNLSGDDGDGNGDFERWDVMYGGWPQFGDLLAWKFLYLGGGNTSMTGVDPAFGDNASTVGEAIYGNMEMITLGASAKLNEKLFGKLSYSNIKFNETIAGVDDDFGDYYQASLKYAYNKYLSFSMYAAMLEAGDAFGANADDATEIYWESQIRF